MPGLLNDLALTFLVFFKLTKLPGVVSLART